MGGFKLATLLLLSVVLTSQRVYGQEDIVPIFPIDEEETYFDISGNKDDNAFPPESSLDDHLKIQCPVDCECSQDEKADGPKITADCSAKELYRLPEINEFDSRTDILLLNGNQLEYLDSAISNLKELEELNLDDNIINNVATGSISELPKLQRLSLANNNLDAFPQDLQLAKSINTVDLSGNFFSEPVTAEDFDSLINIRSIVLPNAAPSLIIQLCENHLTLKQVCTESCDTDVNECANTWTSSSEVITSVNNESETTQRSMKTDQPEDISEILSDTSALPENQTDVFSTEKTPNGDQLFAETAGVESTDSYMSVTTQSFPEIPMENAFRQAPTELEKIDNPTTTEETFEVQIQENDGDVVPVTGATDEKASIEENTAGESTLEETFNKEEIVIPPIAEATDKKASNDEYRAEEAPEENNIFVKPLADEELEDETSDIETPDTTVTETPIEGIEFRETSAEKALVNNIVLYELSTEISPISDEASVTTITLAKTSTDKENIPSSTELFEESTTDKESSDDTIYKSTVDGSSTEQSPVDNSQNTETLVEKESTQFELNGDIAAETTPAKSDIEGGLLLSTTNVNEETTTQSIETIKPSIMGSRILPESDSTDADDLAQNTTANITANETTAEVGINKGGVDNTIIALVIACMVCVVAGVTIRKNWATIKKKIRPRRPPPTIETPNNGITPEEVPLKEKSPV